MDGLHVYLNGDRGLTVLDGLVAAGHGIAAVHTTPGRTGRDDIRAACDRHGLPLEGVADVNDPAFVESLAKRGARLGVVAGFSAIMRAPVIEAPALGTINLHAGRLPHYRGGSPLNWQLINGEAAAGISVLEMDEGIDTGTVLAEAEIPIGPETTIADLHAEANRMFPGLVVQVVERAERDGALEGRAQDRSAGGYWHQRNDGDGRIDWRGQSAEEVSRFVRALTRPYPGARSRWDDREVRVFSARVPELALRGRPGRVCHIQGTGPYVVCADRAVLLDDFEIDGAPGRLPHGVHLT